MTERAPTTTSSSRKPGGRSHRSSVRSGDHRKVCCSNGIQKQRVQSWQRRLGGRNTDHAGMCSSGSPMGEKSKAGSQTVCGGGDLGEHNFARSHAGGHQLYLSPRVHRLRTKRPVDSAHAHAFFPSSCRCHSENAMPPHFPRSRIPLSAFAGARVGAPNFLATCLEFLRQVPLQAALRPAAPPVPASHTPWEPSRCKRARNESKVDGLEHRGLF